MSSIIKNINENDPQDEWDSYYPAHRPLLTDPEPILKIPGLDIRDAEDLRLVIPKQILSEATQRRICEEVAERCVICFTKTPYSEGGRALPLLHRIHVSTAIVLILLQYIDDMVGGNCHLFPDYSGRLSC